MKRIFLLLERGKNSESELILLIFLSVIFLLGPLSGIYNPGKTMSVVNKQYHEDPHGFFTFFILLPEKNKIDSAPQENNVFLSDKAFTQDTTKAK